MAKILLVEDDKSLREIYGVRLMAEGYEIVSAGDGEEALAMAIKERPDLIVSDVMMPKISGFDMLDILRSTTETKDVKVIMMTALSSDDQRARGEALGADRYLVKSQVGIEDVVRTVHDVLGDTPAAAPVAPSFPSVATMAPTTPTPLPPLPPPPVATPAPVAPTLDVPSPTPITTPLNTVTMPNSAEPDTDIQTNQFSPLTPLEPAPVQMPEPVQPIPVAPVIPASTPVTPTPASASAPAPTPAPTPAAPAQPLPEPIAPFSTPAPASLGERVIQPLSDFSNPSPSTIANQMQQVLNTPSDPQNTPPVQ